MGLEHVQPLKQILWGTFQSPLTLFCIPPAAAVVQFFLMVSLANTGFPDALSLQNPKAGLLISGIFALCFGSLLGLMLGFRQMLSGRQKIISSLGMAFNGLYFLGFILFFICIFVTNSTN